MCICIIFDKLYTFIICILSLFAIYLYRVVVVWKMKYIIIIIEL